MGAADHRTVWMLPSSSSEPRKVPVKESPCRASLNTARGLGLVSKKKAGPENQDMLSSVLVALSTMWTVW